MVVLFLILTVQMIIAYYILNSTIYRIMQSTNLGDIVNNILSALVLDQFDNMASLVLFNWLRASFNKLTLTRNFMQVKSTALFENLQIVVYPVLILFSVINVVSAKNTKLSKVFSCTAAK